MNTCGICSHEQRGEIDAALLSRSLRDIAGQFSVSRSALDRHKKTHIPKALTQAKQAIEVADAGSLLSRIETLVSRCESIYEKAAAKEKWTAAIGAARELRGCLELLGKLSGELRQPGMHLSINQLFGDISIRDLSDRQIKELLEMLDKQQAKELGLIERMTNEEIEGQLCEIFGLESMTDYAPLRPVELTPVEAAIWAGFHADSDAVQRRLKEKVAAVKAYEAWRDGRSADVPNTVGQLSPHLPESLGGQ